MCATLGVDRDGCSILKMPNVAAELDVRPLFRDFVVEGLEFGNSFLVVGF